jgi:hypothetical protein
MSVDNVFLELAERMYYTLLNDTIMVASLISPDYWLECLSLYGVTAKPDGELLEFGTALKLILDANVDKTNSFEGLCKIYEQMSSEQRHILDDNLEKYEGESDCCKLYKEIMAHKN